MKLTKLLLLTVAGLSLVLLPRRSSKGENYHNIDTNTPINDDKKINNEHANDEHKKS